MSERLFNKEFGYSEKAGIDQLRKSQLEFGYTIPSDYVYILLKFGKIYFDFIATVKFQEKKYDFYEFYGLELIEWQLRHTRNEADILSTRFWLDSFLCIGQVVSKHILIGNTVGSLNKIYFFDNEETHIDYVSDSIFDFINYNIEEVRV